MDKAPTTPFDAAEYLDTPEAVSEFLADAFESANIGFIMHALGIAAKARGITALAEETGLTRQTLYKALADGGNPEFATVMKVTRALGVTLVPVPIPG
jgi:probable addiction module antidote protein